MIRTRHTAVSADNGGEAITRILRAEQEAEEALREALRQADELRAAARRRALEIRRRADERITRLNARCGERTAELIERLRAAELGEEALSERPIAPEALERAACRVADWLLGSEQP
jgi:hypothetical protein